MTRNDLRIAWRVLVREPAYSAVVVFGLALGFAASFLLFGFVHYSFAYDGQVPQNDQVFVFKHRLNLIPNARWTEFMPLPVRDTLVASGLPLTVCAVMPRTVIAQAGVRTQKIELTVVDTAFAEMFGVRAAQGDIRAALARPDGIALTREGAFKLFGSRAALGQPVDIEGKRLTVMALLENARSNTTVPYDYLVGIGSSVAPHGEHLWNSLAGRMYVRAGRGVTAAMLEQLVQAAVDNSPFKEMAPGGLPGFAHLADIRVGRLSDAYFDTEVAAFKGGARGDRKTVLGLAAVALLILLVAAINYVNLATVRMLRRQREIGVRKSLGASGTRLVGQFMAESVLVALLATASGLLLAWLLLPLFSELVDRELDAFFTPATLAVALLTGVLVGVASGLYPCFVALGVRPTAALAGPGNTETPGGGRLRAVLTTVQFMAAIALTAGALAVSCQTRYASHRDPGFDPARLMLVDLPRGAALDKVAALRGALARLPGVDGVAVSNLAIGSPEMPSSSGFMRDGGPDVRMNVAEVSANFFSVYGLRARAGRGFDPRRDADGVSHAVMINVAAMRALGYASPGAALGQHINRGYYEIIGIAPDLRHQNLREAVQATVYTLEANNPGVLTLRTGGGDAALNDAIAALWPRYFPSDTLNLHGAAGVFAANYREDARLAAMLAASGMIAVGIAGFGIYVLAAYTVERRKREIALRKLYGASARQLARLIGRDFVLLVGVAALAALPLAALGIERYLAGFVERAPLGAWPLAAAVALAAGVATLACWRHVAGAMRVAPADAFRSE